MSVANAKIFVRGVELKRPKNVGTYDVVLCGALIAMYGPKVRIKCTKPMQIMKVIDTGLQIKKSTLQCDGWSGHIIPSQQMFVAVCRDERHLNGKPHVVCSVCIENYEVYKPFLDPNYLIHKDYYQYKPKKNGK